MSTWLGELRKTDPELAKAYAIVGNTDVKTLRTMVSSLRISSHLNTKQDNDRLNAAQYILNHYNKRR